MIRFKVFKFPLLALSYIFISTKTNRHHLKNIKAMFFYLKICICRAFIAGTIHILYKCVYYWLLVGFFKKKTPILPHFINNMKSYFNHDCKIKRLTIYINSKWFFVESCCKCMPVLQKSYIYILVLYKNVLTICIWY